MSSAAEKKIDSAIRGSVSIGATRALLASMLHSNKKEMVSVFDKLSRKQLDEVYRLVEAGDPVASQFYSSMTRSEAGRATMAAKETLAYLLDGDLPGKVAGTAPNLPPEEVEFWKPVQLAGPEGWNEHAEPGVRDYTVPLMFSRNEAGVPIKRASKPLPLKALPNAGLVRALSAHKRDRHVNHPDGNILDLDSLVGVAARIPGSNPWTKHFGKPSIPHLVVLVDCSGSMAGSGMKAANYASTVLALSAIAARCPFDIIPYEGYAQCGSDMHVSWRPGKPIPDLPTRFRAGGSNDMMGATIQAAEYLFKAPDRRARRISITISDSDIASTCYRSSKPKRTSDRNLLVKLGLANHSSAPGVVASMLTGMRFSLYEAWADMVDVLHPLGVEAHAMFVGDSIDPQFLRTTARIYVDRYRSAVFCKMNELEYKMNELATNILQHR